jgi:hypothetical protein
MQYVGCALERAAFGTLDIHFDQVYAANRSSA